GRKSLLGGRRIRFDSSYHHAFYLVFDLVLLAQLVRQIGEVESERFFNDRLSIGNSVIFIIGICRYLFVIFEPSELDRFRFFLALAHDDDFDVLADRRIRDDLGQIAHLLHVFPVELDDHISGLDPRRLGGTLFVDTRHQRTTCRLDAEAFRNFITHLLDAHTEPAAANLFELTKLIDHRYDGL